MSKFVTPSETQAQWSGVGKRARAVQKKCVECGAGLPFGRGGRKVRCGPCSSERLAKRILEYGRSHYKPRKQERT